MSSYKQIVKFEMSDGRELTCEYNVTFIPGCVSGPPEYCYPDEAEVGEPDFFIEGEQVDFVQMPVGLSEIAEQMWCADESDKRFTFSREEFEDGHFEPEDW